MRLALIITLTSITALVSVPDAASAEAPSPQTIAELIETFYKDRGDVRAEFEQKVSKPGRKRAMIKVGSVFFKRPGKMRWEYKKPEALFYVSDGSVLWSYQPEDKLVTRLDVTSSELYHQTRYLFGQGNLSSDFDLSAAGDAKDGVFPLALKPKKSSRNFKSLTLGVDAKTGEIRWTKLVDPYDNVSEISFTKVQYAAVDDKFFKFTPPAGATVKNLSKKAGGK
ncbi:MAG: outer membrane lipoprotein carrier protein [Myxococcota bacterium]|jgi:outer membrane lipoprotein carrier protein